VILSWGLLEPTALRAAVANNLWSLRFIQAAYADQPLDPELTTPPPTHQHAGMLLAIQAMETGDLDLAAQYLYPLRGLNDHIVRHNIANLYYLMGDYPPAIATWKDLGKYNTLEQAYRVLEGEGYILSLKAAYELIPEIYGRSLIHALLTRGGKQLEDSLHLAAIATYQEIITEFPED